LLLFLLFWSLPDAHPAPITMRRPGRETKDISFSRSSQIVIVWSRLDEENVGCAQDLALLRAAELTMERGYESFEVVSRSSDVVEDRRPDTRVEFRRDYVVTRDCGLLGCTTSTTPVYTSGGFGTYTSRDETIVAIEVKMSDRHAGENAQVYDASELAANIRARL